MEETKLFRTVWRINSLILMAAGVLGVGFLCFGGVMVVRDITRTRNTRNIVNIEDE